LEEEEEEEEEEEANAGAGTLARPGPGGNLARASRPSARRAELPAVIARPRDPAEAPGPRGL